MNSTKINQEKLLAKINSVFARAGKAFDEIPSEAVQLTRTVGANKNTPKKIKIK